MMTKEICVPRPDQRVWKCGPADCQTSFEKNLVRRSRREVTLLPWPRGEAVAPRRTAPARRTGPAGRSCVRRCRREKQHKSCTAKRRKSARRCTNGKENNCSASAEEQATCQMRKACLGGRRPKKSEKKIIFTRGFVLMIFPFHLKTLESIYS